MAGILAADQSAIQRAARCINEGGVVAFPTASSYGLAVDGFSVQGVERLSTLKRRPESQPFPLLVRDRAMAENVVGELSEIAAELVGEHWPGPLTLVARPVRALPAPVVSELGVGVRVSHHPTARRLVEAVGRPITCTSANLSGSPAAETAAEVQARIGPQVDLILEGDCGGNPPSTVVKPWAWGIEVLRTGPVAVNPQKGMTHSPISRDWLP